MERVVVPKERALMGIFICQSALDVAFEITATWNLLGIKLKLAQMDVDCRRCRRNQGYLVSLSTYYLKWKTDYLSLKVSRPAEDICFANKHKILSNHTYTTEDGEGINKKNDCF
jgi:hypothetical protein